MTERRRGSRSAAVAGRWLSGLVATAGLLGLSQPAQAAMVQINSIDLVMAGASSSGAKQVWVPMVGQPAGVPVDCVYGSWSLFFVDPSSGVDPASFLAVLLTAKASNRPVVVAYDIDAGSSDFFGFGITKCRMSRIALQ